MMSTTKEQPFIESELGGMPGFDSHSEKHSVEPQASHVEIAKEANRKIEEQSRQAVKGDDSDGKIDWTLRSFVAALTLCMLYSGSQLPLYFSAGPLSIIAKDLKASQQSAWIPVSYTLASAAPLPFSGYLQDIFGRRTIALGAAMLVIVGSILMGTAHSFAQGIAGMSISGAGAGVTELTALAGISEVVPVRARGYTIAIMTAISFPWGPYVLYSQLLAKNSTWRWGFWIVVIYMSVAWTGVAVTYNPTKHSRLAGFSRLDQVKRIDYLGGILSIGGLTIFLIAMQSGGYTHPWKSAYVLSCLILGILTLISFILWEVYGAKYPIIPRGLFTRRVVSMAFIVSFVAGMNFYSLTNFGPLYFSSVYGADPVTVGIRNIGTPTATILGAVVGNYAISKFPAHARLLLCSSCVIMTVFGGGIVAVNPNNPRLAVAFTTLAGFGVGGLIVPAATIAIIACPDDIIATTAALTLAVRSVGGSIGYSIYYNIFVNKLTTQLPTMVATYALSAGLPATSLVKFLTAFLGGDIPGLGLVDGVTPDVIAAATLGTQWAYAKSLRWVFVTSIPFGVCAIIAAFFLGDIRKYMTNRITSNLVH